MMTRRTMCCRMVGVSRARLMASFDAVLEVVSKEYPNAHREGSAGGWSWTDEERRVVAASAFVESPPHGRHWLAIKKSGD